MKRKILLFIITCFIFQGCAVNEKNNQNVLENTKGNCGVMDCINQIEPDNTVSEINSIIGFNGELIDEKYNKYYWELSDDTGIEVSYYSGSKGTIAVDVQKDLLKNNNVNFSRYDELKSEINGGITYDEFISYIGNEKGEIIEKSSLSTKYMWVDKDGNYLKASFSNSTNKCTVVTGMIK